MIQQLTFSKIVYKAPASPVLLSCFLLLISLSHRCIPLSPSKRAHCHCLKTFPCFSHSLKFVMTHILPFLPSPYQQTTRPYVSLQLLPSPLHGLSKTIYISVLMCLDTFFVVVVVSLILCSVNTTYPNMLFMHTANKDFISLPYCFWNSFLTSVYFYHGRAQSSML